MASTDEMEVEAHERHRGCSPASGNDSSRFDGVDRDRNLGRPDRAASRRRGRELLPSRRAELVGLHRLVRRDRADLPRRRRGGRASVPAQVAASLSIGLVSFFAPFAVVGLLCFYALDWSRRQAEIGGLALSTTSLAVVYAVLVETGLNRELVGKRLIGNLRHRHRDGDRPDRLVRQADPLDRAVRARLGRAGPHAAEALPLVLLALWRSGDRARDQASSSPASSC